MYAPFGNDITSFFSISWLTHDTANTTKTSTHELWTMIVLKFWTCLFGPHSVLFVLVFIGVLWDYIWFCCPVPEKTSSGVNGLPLSKSRRWSTGQKRGSKQHGTPCWFPVTRGGLVLMRKIWLSSGILHVCYSITCRFFVFVQPGEWFSSPSLVHI